MNVSPGPKEFSPQATTPTPPPNHPILHSHENKLEHWDRDKMDTILQTTFSNQFSSMNIVGFDPIFTEIEHQGFH